MSRKERRRWQKKIARRKAHARARNMRQNNKCYPNGARIHGDLLSPPRVTNPAVLAVLRALFGNKAA